MLINGFMVNRQRFSKRSRTRLDLGSGWSIGDDKRRTDGTNAFLIQ